MMKFPCSLFCLLFFSLPGLISVVRGADEAVLQAQQTRVEVIQKVAPAVVAIFGSSGGGGGSGVLITPDGYALTNFHVTNGAGTFMKCGLNNGKLYDAVIVGIDPTGDVALIKLLGRNDFPTAKMGDSDKVEVGDWTYAMGNPFLLATDFQPTVTYGIVSGVHRYQYPAGGNFLEYTDCIQVDTSINPGNSGGPLFNSNGEIIGINGRGSFEKRGRVNSGAGYAISINQIRYFLGHLKSGRIVDHATLGATVYADDEGAVRIGSILGQSEAFRRGLREGDELVSFAGRNIRSVNQFKNILGIYPKGWMLPVTYRRDGEKQDIIVRLRALHRKSEMAPKKRPPGPMPPEPKPEPKPKPGDDEKGEEKKEDQKKKPPQLPIQRLINKPAVPKEYKHLYVKKAGFANYYFNQLQQNRLLKVVSTWGDYSKVSPKWQITGKDNTQAEFKIGLDEKFVGFLQGEEVFVQQLEGADFENLPPNSGGMLSSIYHLKLLLTSKGKEFTEFYYLGTEPLDGSPLMVDVLIARLTGVTSRFYFHHETAKFIGFDTQLSDDVDECKIRFKDQIDQDGKQFPKQFQVSYQGQEFNTFTITKISFSDEAETK